MVDKKLARARLVAQGMTPAPRALGGAVSTVAHLGALQGQDVRGAVSSVALRVMHGNSSLPVAEAVASVRDAFASGELVRGYPMRGTVFVTSARDLWWITDLCAGSVVRQARKRSPQLGLDDQHFEVAREVLARECASPEGATRAHIIEAWRHAGVPADRGCSYHLLKHFLSTMFVTYGPLTTNGTLENRVVLSDRWLPRGSDLETRFNGDRRAATAELLLRYLTSHGPASLRDFQWWTKLPLTLIRTAFGDIEAEVVRWGSDRAGEDLYCAPELAEVVAQVGRAVDRPQLLPPFDEIILGYPDRTYIVPAQHHETLVPGNNGVFRSAALAGGHVVGYWKRKGPANKRSLVLEPFTELTDARIKKFHSVFGAYPHASA